MRAILVVILLCVTLFARGEIDKKIQKTSSKLHSFSRNYSTLNRKMSDTARAILKQKREIIKQDAYLKQLKADLQSKESSYEANTKQLQTLKKRQEKLKEKQNKIERDLIYFINKTVSLSVVLNEATPVNAQSLIELEVLKSMLQESKSKAKKLSNIYLGTAKTVLNLHTKTTSLEHAIALMDAKRKELLKKQAENKKALYNLKLAKASYKKELQKLLQRQNALKKTLARLNLIKIDAIRKAEEEKARREAFKRQKINLNEKLPKVKKHGSSYQSIKTIPYTGKKTIAPLHSYTIMKKYGTYRDPIYGIKIFNESISLKPRKANAKVMTVFNGKVIYADKTAVLNNIVIVEHKNGLHTIYANLSQIAPNIRKGKKVHRGAVIGRVKHELIFEVTQKSAHINPIRLFR